MRGNDYGAYVGLSRFVDKNHPESQVDSKKIFQ